MENMSEVRDQIQSIPALEHRLEGIRARLAQAEHETNVLLQRYEKERRDVEKIQQESLSAFMLRVVGKYEDRLEKELQEELEAKAVYDEKRLFAEDLRWECGKLEQRLGELHGLSRQFAAALERRRAELGQKLTAPESRRYRELEQEHRDMVAQLTEIDEAMTVAHRAIDMAHKALDSLTKAENWATFDMFSKGGLLTHAAKYSHVDDAEQAFGHLRYLLQELKAELADVNSFHIPSLVQIDSGERALEFWFDNIFFDLSVRRKISGNIGRVEQLGRQLEQLARDLDSRRRELLAGLERNRAAEEDLLVAL